MCLAADCASRARPHSVHYTPLPDLAHLAGHCLFTTPRPDPLCACAPTPCLRTPTPCLPAPLSGRARPTPRTHHLHMHTGERLGVSAWSAGASGREHERGYGRMRALAGRSSVASARTAG